MSDETEDDAKKVVSIDDAKKLKKKKKADGEGDDEEKKERGPSPADLLVNIAKTKAKLFRDAGDDVFATISIRGHDETLKLRSVRFTSWLSNEYFSETKRVPSGQNKADALAVLVGIALHDGTVERVFLRVGEHGDAIYVDVGNQERDVIEIRSSGWRVIRNPPICFIRPKAMQALPMPTRGGSINELRQFLNVKDDGQFKLLIAWMIAALRRRGPFSILVYSGEHGTAKTSATRIIRRFVDPNLSPVRTMPKAEDDLAIAARGAHVLAFDNASGIAPWLSDALCRVATGGGLSKRALYTDDEEVILDAIRPVVLNGIEDICTRADLADRALVVTLPTIPKSERIQEKHLFKKLEVAAPRIFGALLNGLVSAVAREDQIEFAELPRMADFAIWATAAERGLGWNDGDFIRAYEANRRDAVRLAIEADPVASAVVLFMEKRTTWEGSASDLHVQLAMLTTEEIRRSQAWPKTASRLGGALRRAAPPLRVIGIAYTDTRSNSQRTITLTSEQRDQTASPPSPPSPGGKNSGGSRDSTSDGTVTTAVTANERQIKLSDGSDASDGIRRLSSVLAKASAKVSASQAFDDDERAAIRDFP